MQCFPHDIARPLAAFDDLTLHYQPIVSATTGRLVAAEALARVSRADGSVGSAQGHLSAAESEGRSHAIDRYAVTTVLNQAARWRAEGLLVPIHVNVSASTLSEAEAEGFVRWLEVTGVNAASLTLEITESVQCDDIERLARITALCRSTGVEIAVDDFGCGYSTMALLQIIRADVLKIDRRFVAPLLEDPRTQVLVRHFISMAHELDMRVIAEGVEDAAQAAWLARAGCDELQGFVFSRALREDAFYEWAMDRRSGR